MLQQARRGILDAARVAPGYEPVGAHEDRAAQGAAIDSVARHLDDPAEVVAVAHRYFVDLARTACTPNAC